MRTAIVSWSQRLYNKWVKILFNIESAVEVSCFPPPHRLKDAQAGCRNTAGVEDERIAVNRQPQATTSPSL